MRKKLSLYSEYMKSTSKLLKLNAPYISSEARYNAAETAESISSDLMFVSLLENTNNIEKVKFKERSNRLKVLAKNLYSQNILSEKKHPRLQESLWVKKSHIKISGLENSNLQSLNKMFQIDSDYTTN